MYVCMYVIMWLFRGSFSGMFGGGGGGGGGDSSMYRTDSETQFLSQHKLLSYYGDLIDFGW